MNFNELNLRSEILRAISEMGYEQATDIQAGSIPSILEGQDVTGRSSTGTGKTAAFGIPIVQRTAENEDRSSVLILAPTRELALQITGEIRKYAKYLPCISVACIYGGQPMDNQIRALKKARIVVGTPGRVMDHMRRRTLKLDHLKTVVLDEADEMLNMGFIDDIRTILGNAPAERQTILFSATLSPEIIKITEEFQTETVFVKADKGKRTAAKIDQSFYYVPKDQKNDALRLLLEASAPRRALIFCNTKSMVDELSSILSDFGYRCAGLHGDTKQNQRNAVMRDFKSGRIRLLIATDVAARGIDVEDVDAVFNYDVPQELEYYVHRIGRTGRAGREGASYTLVAGRVQLSHLREIERYIHAQIEERPLPTTASILEQRETEFKNSLKEQLSEGIDEKWLAFIDSLELEGITAREIAALLCERTQKKNRRTASLQDVVSRPAPKRASAGSFSRNSSRNRSGRNFRDGQSKEETQRGSRRRKDGHSSRNQDSNRRGSQRRPEDRTSHRNSNEFDSGRRRRKKHSGNAPVAK